MDHKNAVIVFDNSQTGSTADWLIPPRRKEGGHWRYLPFSVKWELNVQADATDKELNMACMKRVLDDLFRAPASSWQAFLKIGQIHITILEDKIYGTSE